MKLNGKTALRAAKYLAGFAAMFFCASCVNQLTEGTVSSSNSSSKTLNIAVTNYSDLVYSDSSLAESSSSRTIMPDSYDASGVDLYIYGSAANGDVFSAPAKVEFTGATSTDGSTSTTVGTIKIDADVAQWEFTLVAVEKNSTAPANLAEMKSNAVLIGYASLDMTYGDTAKFTLSPDGLTKEASVALKLYNDGWTTPDGYSIKAGIYKLTDGSDATTTGDGTGDTTAQDITSLDSTEPADANYSLDTMTPGTYVFKVIYTNSSTSKTFIWSDTLIVLPGKTVDNSIAIPNVIGTVPSAPADFKASYEADSEDERTGYYTVDFEWARGSKNELSYELELLTLADDTTALPTSDDEWTTAAVKTDASSVTFGSGTNSDSVTDFSASEVYSSGSLLTGNKAASLFAQLGIRYAARLRAVNDAGSSDWAYVSVDGTTGTVFTSAVINRYRTTYHLNGGTYYETGDTTASGSQTDIVEYACQSTDGNSIIQPDGATENGPLLKYNTATWSAWVDGSGNTVTETTYTGSANLDLYAKYSNGTSDVEFLQKEDYDIKGTWITVDGTALTDGQKTLTIDAESATESVWNFKPVADGNKITDDFAYDTVILTLTKGGETYFATSADNAGTAGTDFTIPLSKLNVGTYQVTLGASYSTSIYVSYPVTVTIER